MSTDIPVGGNSAGTPKMDTASLRKIRDWGSPELEPDKLIARAAEWIATQGLTPIVIDVPQPPIKVEGLNEKI